MASSCRRAREVLVGHDFLGDAGRRFSDDPLAEVLEYHRKLKKLPSDLPQFAVVTKGTVTAFMVTKVEDAIAPARRLFLRASHGGFCDVGWVCRWRLLW